MASINRRILLTGALLVSCSWAFQASAQERVETESATESPEGADIVVTAQKREQQAIDVPMGLSVLGGDRLEDLRINNVLELAYQVPGFIAQESVPGRTLYTLRGVGNSFGSSALVGAYLDDVDVTSTGPAQLDVRLYDLDRVEVLRGPQGTLWGAGSVGGTIRFITNKPDLNSFGGKAEAAVFGQNRGDISGEVQGAVNIPLVNDVLGLRLSGSYMNWGGWIDQPAANRKDFNDNELINVRARALFRPSDRFDVNGTIIIHRNKGGGKNIANLLPYHDSLFQSFVDPTLKTPFRDEYDHFNLTMRYDLGPATLVSATGRTNAENFNWDTRRLELTFRFIPSIPGTNVLQGYGYGQTNTKITTQELRLTSNGDKALSWTGGVYYRHEDVKATSVQTQYAGPIPFVINSAAGAAAKNSQWAGFADISYALSDRFTLGAGLRYFEEKRRSTNLVNLVSQEGKFSHLSPRIYASFAATDDINFYVNVAEGFRSGGFNPPSAVAVGASPTYDPETLRSYEIGTKMSLFDHRLYAEIAAFYSDYTDMQAVGVLPGIVANVTSNIGKAEIKGIEYALQWRPTRKLMLGVAGSFIDSKVVKLDASQTSHIVGDPLDQVAKYNVAITADYAFHWGPNLPGFIRLGFNEQGPVQWTSRNASLIQPIGRSDRLSFLNANIGIEFGRAKFEIFGRNILDESGNSSPYTCCGIQPQPRPFQFGARLAFDFE